MASIKQYYIYYPCPGTPGEIFFSNQGPSWIDSQGFVQFSSDPSGLLPLNQCYHVTLFEASSVPTPYIPIDWNTVTAIAFSSCEQCQATSGQPCLECPPGFTLNEGVCEQTNYSPASYTGNTIPITAGAKDPAYSSFGLILYPDITGYTFPLYGNGATVPSYSVIDNNGAGAIVTPLLGGFASFHLSNLWGMYDPGTGCPATGTTGGRLNATGIWPTPASPGNYTPYNEEVCFEFCVTTDVEKQYLIGIGGDNIVKIYVDDLVTPKVHLNAINGTIVNPFAFWHVFPITLSAGTHIIKLCGINLQNVNPPNPPTPTVAAIGGEIYDIDLATFQLNLTTAATVPPFCGNVDADLEPYILFSTRDLIGTTIADPDSPGEWVCPDGYTFTTCNGTPECLQIATAPTIPCGYEFVPCCGGDSIYYTIAESIPLTIGSVVFNEITQQCYTVVEVFNAPALPYPAISISDLTVIDQGCEDIQCTIPCNPCECIRIRYTGTPGPGTQNIDYVDCELNDAVYVVTLDGEWGPKLCSKFYSLPSPDYEVETFGDCSLNSSNEYECPPCYVLTDCDGIKDPIYTYNPNISQYITNNNVITIDGDSTCWIPSVSNLGCECAIVTSVQYVYDNCEECGLKSYKLTNCDTGDIIYTTTDLSAYTAVTIEIDCGGCWTVEELDFLPPSDQPVNVITSFASCEICNSEYYVLTDCAGIEDPIITITNLSDYVGGVIKLDFCPDICWSVARTTPVTTAGVVNIDQGFETCSDCWLATFECTGQSVVLNENAIGLRLDFVDCEGVLTNILIEETTINLCGLLVLPDVNIISITNYGPCIDGEFPPIPPPTYPRRRVTPGYNTPACTTEYYENVMCNYSEWMYKDVLERRYGISNCCPDELMKWEIKKELLQLAVLVNPDYTCLTQPDCGCCNPVQLTPRTCGS